MANMPGRIPDYIAPPPPAKNPDDEEPTLPPMLEPGVLTQDANGTLPLMGRSTDVQVGKGTSLGNPVAAVAPIVAAAATAPTGIIAPKFAADAALGQAATSAITALLPKDVNEALDRWSETGAGAANKALNPLALIDRITGQNVSNEDAYNRYSIPLVTGLVQGALDPRNFALDIGMAAGSGLLNKNPIRIRPGDNVPAGFDRYGLTAKAGEPSVINQPVETVIKASMPGEAPIGFPFNWGSKWDDLPEAAKDAYRKSQSSEFPLSDSSLKNIWDNRSPENREAIGKTLEDRGLVEPPAKPVEPPQEPPPPTSPEPPSPTPPEPPAPSVNEEPGIPFGAAEKLRDNPETPAPIRDPLEEAIPTYSPARNTQQGFESAKARLDTEGPDAMYNRLHEKDAWSDYDALDAEALYDHYVQTGDYDKANEFLNNDYFVKRRNLGQAVQAGTISSGYTPSGAYKTATELVNEGDKSKNAENLVNVNRKLTERNIANTEERGKRIAEGLQADADAIASGKKLGETPRSKAAKTGLQKDIQRFENEGRLPKDISSGELSDLDKQWNDFKRRIDDAGWELDHGTAKDIQDRLEVYSQLKGSERQDAFDSVRQEILDNHYDYVKAQSDLHREAAGYTKGVSKVIDNLSGLTENKALKAAIPDEMNKLRELGTLSRKVGDYWPAESRQEMVEGLYQFLNMPDGEAKVNGVKNFVNRMYADNITELKHRVALINEGETNLKKVSDTVKFLEDQGREPGKLPSESNASADIQKNLDKVKAYAKQLNYLSEEDMNVNFRGTTAPVADHVETIRQMPNGPEKAQASRELAQAVSDDLLPNLKAKVDQQASEAAMHKRMAEDVSKLTGETVATAREKAKGDYGDMMSKARSAFKDANVNLPEDVAKDIVNDALEIHNLGNPEPGTFEAFQKQKLIKHFENKLSGIAPQTDHQKFMDTLGIVRSLKSGPDISMPGRQGLFSVGSQEWWKSFPDMIKSAKSPEYYENFDAALRSSNAGVRAEKAGVHLNDIEGDLNSREGSAATQLTGKLPLYKGSDRAAAAYLNRLRVEKFDTMAKLIEGDGQERWLGVGPKREQWRTKLTEKDEKDLADWVNVITGRGNVGDVSRSEVASTIVNRLFYSLRLATSRFQSMSKLMNAMVDLVPGGSAVTGKIPGLESYSRPVATAIAQDGLRSTALILTMLATAKQAGLEVDADPRSSNFAQIRDRNTGFHVDILAGAASPIKLLTQITLGALGIDNVKGVNGQTFLNQDYGSMLTRYGRSKTEPLAALLLDLTIGNGKDFIGRRYGLSTTGENVINSLQGKPADDNRAGILENLLGPLVFNDVPEYYKRGGPISGALMSALQTLGLGTSAYDELTDLKDKIAQQKFGVNYGDLPPVSAQGKPSKALVDSSDELKTAKPQDAPDLSDTQWLLSASQRNKEARAANEQKLAKTLDLPRSPEERRKDIQEYLTSNSQVYQANYGDKQTQSALERRHANDPKDRVDELRTKYLSIQPQIETNPNDPDYGQVDFSTADEERQKILTQAKSEGIDPDTITSRNYELISDPKAKAAVQDYDVAQKYLRPYFDIRTKALDATPGLKEFVRKIQMESDPKIKAALKNTAAYKNFNQAVKAAEVGYLASHPGTKLYLEKYGYNVPTNAGSGSRGKF